MVRTHRYQRARARGTTLVEVLIVVAIIALVAGGVGVASFKYWIRSQKQTTETNAREIRQAVRTWWLSNDPLHCPRFDELVATGTLDRGSSTRDAWGRTWRIDCSDEDVTVVSAGPDGQLGTDDDIEAPPT